MLTLVALQIKKDIYYKYSSITEPSMKKAAIKQLVDNSVFYYYDTEKKQLSAPITINLLYNVYLKNKDKCVFKVVQYEKEDRKVYCLDLDYSFNYIPAFSIDTQERLNMYRYVVLARLCNTFGETEALRLFDTVVKREAEMPIEKVYMHHKSDLGMRIDVIANMRIRVIENGNKKKYVVSAIMGNIVTADYIEHKENKKEAPTVQRIVNEKFDICVIDNKRVVIDLNYNFSWEQVNVTLLQLPAVNKVVLPYNEKHLQYALKNVETVIIPATVTELDGRFLGVLPKLKNIVCQGDKYAFENDMLIQQKGTRFEIINVTAAYTDNKIDLTNNILASHALQNCKHVTQCILQDCVINKCAFYGSAVNQLLIGKNVTLMPGALRGMSKLTKIQICNGVTTNEFVRLCNVNVWRSLEDFNVTDKKFVGKTIQDVKITFAKDVIASQYLQILQAN